ncbi:hypothetical protein ACS0TY_015214 [Phlomoides rotata]
MDFSLKQWRDHDSEEEEKQQTSPKQPRLLHTPPALPLFVPDPYPSHHSSSTSPATKFPKMGSYFSLAQWQELELQALIFRHIIAGAAVPPDLLHLVKKSLISSHYLCNPLTQYYPHYQQSLVQSGYWGKGAMDPEPGRCRRTDGKKWRCSRDVVAGQKYCERHMHRGRNRSRKPVETPTSAAAYGGDGEALKGNNSTAQGTSTAAAGGAAAAAPPRFSLSGPLSSVDLHLNRRPLDSINETKCTFESQNDGHTDGGRTLRRFFDDWPRSLHETDNATSLSISTPGSDFSLKLGTGNGNGNGDESKSSGERDRPQLNWGMGAWENNRVAPMGGPLAEALRSSVSTSSPTSVLHRLARSSASENSYVSS